MRREALSGFAVDLGGTKLTVARIDGGQVVEIRTEATNRSGTLAMQIDHMERLLADLRFGPGACLGVAVTGLVASDGIWSAVNADTLPAIKSAPLRDALTERFGGATCCNDAVAATVAEARFGAGQGCRDFAYMTVSTGIGGGLVLNGAPVTGGRGFAGHFGFTTSRNAPTPCGSGREGTVEANASGMAIARRAAELGHRGLSAKDVFAEAAMGAAWADQLVAQSARCVATLIGDIAAMVDPERIAIGGSIGLAPGYLDRVKSCLNEEPAMFRVPVSLAALGQEGPLLGALAMSSLCRT